MSLRVIFPVVASILLLTVSPLSAQLDPEPKTPYLWRIVLKVQPHPLLTPTFREQLKRDLEASLQPALGTLGTVDVIDLTDTPRDHWDSLWQQFDDKGFAALEAPRDLTGAKTHFLKLEYKDGLYLLEARQHDGFAGLSSGYAGDSEAKCASAGNGWPNGRAHAGSGFWAGRNRRTDSRKSERGESDCPG